MISGLDAFVFKKAACGAYHTLVVNEWGQLFSWGSNTEGQLGNDIYSYKVPSYYFFKDLYFNFVTGLNSRNFMECSPRMVKTLGTSIVIQIACGMKHALALTNNGELYSWGSNSEGQLGLGVNNKYEIKPKLINSLIGIPIVFIACGGYHSIAVSKSGTVKKEMYKKSFLLLEK